MSWAPGHTGHSRGGGLPPAWGLPPGHAARHAPGHPVRHQHDRDAAARKRKEEAQAARLERQRQAGLLENENLFKPPSRMDNNHTSDVEKVMGKYNAANVAILNTPSYLGVDYAPPTPAPAREHIIGEEDEIDTAEPVSSRSAPSHIRKPSQPLAPRQPSGGSLRPPANPPPVLKPPSSSQKPATGSWDAPMAPPQLPTKSSHKPHQSSCAKSDSQHPKKRPVPAQKLSPLTMPSNSKKSGLSSQQSIEDDKKLEDIFKEMKHPHAIPEPLSGIETPRVDVDYNTQKQKKNVYAMGIGFNPFHVDDSNNIRSSSPQKKISESENIKTSTESAHDSPMPSLNKDTSSSEQDSSSESESEVESDKEKENLKFDLGSLMPIKSPQVVNPSPRHPAPSPYSVQPTLSPAAPSPGPGVKAGPGAGSPLPTFQGLPELLAPLSPLEPMLSADSDQESRVKVKQRPATRRSDFDSDDENRKSFKENKKPKSSNKRGRKSSVKSGSGSEQRHKSKPLINDDSDSEPEQPVKSVKLKSHHGRSQSSTPTKKPSSKKQPGSAQSTPRQRPTSTHSTPSRDRKRDPSVSPSSKYRKPSSAMKSGKKVPSSRRSTLSLSEDDDFPIKSPEPVKKTKSAVLSSVFGAFKGVGGGKGGKGKDKRGKGGITVMEKDESTQIPNDKVPSVSVSSPSVNNHQSSPKVNRDKGKKNSWIDSIEQENHTSLQNISKKEASGLSEDLTLSDDESNASPAVSRHQPFTQSSSLTSGTGQRPSLLISIPLSRLGKSLDSLQNKFRSKNKKQIVKQECWITSEDERGGSGRKRKSSESPVKSESDQRHGAKRSSDKTAQHRKSNERTHLGEKESEIVSEPRKRRDRDQSPDNANDSESDQFSKRLKTSPSSPNSIRSLEANQGSYFGPEPEPPPPDPSLVPPGPASHSAWPGPGMMLPPPHPPKRVYFSYFERRHQENEAFDDEEENVVDEAKRLKHEADQETNMNNRCRKYLQAIMMFSVCGSRTEAMGDKMTAYSLYLQTLSIIKFVMKLTNSSRNNNQDVDTRLVVLSLRAQSLLNLKLYKMKRHELKDYQKTIQDVLANSEDEQASAEHGQNRTEQMSTPSPAGSEGSNASRSSDYYSSGENRLPGGVLTPPTAGPVCLSIPRNVMQNQYKFCSYLSQCHELWEQADLFVARGEGKGRGTCEEFFIRLDQECGPLTLHSSLKDLVTYTRRSLDAIEHSRGQSSGDLMLGSGSGDSESFR